MDGQPTLLDLFAPAISRTLAVSETLLRQGGQYPQPCNDVYQELFELIQRCREDAVQAGKRDVDINESMFALVAWIDETFAPHRPWYDNGVPLQITLFSTANAGNEFFDHLKNLASDQEETREVFFVMLALGFVGEMYHDTGQTSELARVTDLHGRQIAVSPAAIATLAQEYVTPQPYSTDDPPPPKPVRSYWKWILLGLLTLVLLAGGAFALWWFVFRTPAVDRNAVLAEIERILSQFECADLQASLSENFEIVVEGYVESDDDLRQLESRLKAIGGVASVESTVLIYFWPFCEAIGIIEDYTAVGAQRPGAPTVEPERHALAFVEGEDLIVRAAASSLYDGYLYVDLIQKNGLVVHMLPTPFLPDNRMRSGEQIVLGMREADAGDGDRFYKIEAPFGADMIVAYATPEPLFRRARPEGEDAREYFPDWREALQAMQDAGLGGSMLSSYIFITSRGRAEPGN